MKPTISKTLLTGLAAASCLLMHIPAANAQTVLGRLATLLTEQQPSGTFVPDPAAAAATRDTVAGLFLVELGNLPLAASSGGFVYRLRPDLGVFERATNDFGPLFAERTLGSGRGQLALGLTFQYASFGSLQGADLTSGTFPTNAARFSGAVDPFSVDTLKLDLQARSATPFVSYGLTDKVSVSAIVPLVNMRFTGERVRSVNGVKSLQSIQSGSATGLGDVVVNGRYRALGNGARGVSLGADLRLPTGNQLELLGTDDVASRFLGIGSWEDGRLGVHVNGGFGLGGVSREVFWNWATTFAATPRLTVIGELMGRRLSELSELSDVYQPHPVLAGVETMRWLPTDRGLHTTFVVAGAKWNVAQSLLVNTSLLIRVTDAGLRARVTPAISIDYAFER